MRILVTGGMGYVGSTLVAELLDKTSHEVTILDRLDYKVSQQFLSDVITNKRVTFIRGDIRELGKLYSAINTNDVIVHMAALVGPICDKYIDECFSVNALGSQILSNLCKELGKKLIVLSTCSNYGKTEKPVDESGDLFPVSNYAISKVAMEKHIINNKIPSIILRCGTAFGYSPGRTRFDLLFNEWVRDSSKGIKELSIFQPDAWRPFCHVRDISKAIILSLGKIPNEPKVLNIGYSNIQKKKLAMIIVKDKNRIKLSDTEDMRDYKVDFSEAQRYLGFKAEWSYERGMDELLLEMNTIHETRMDLNTSNV